MVRSFGAVSKWRNALLVPAKPASERYEELGLATVAGSSANTGTSTATTSSSLTGTASGASTSTLIRCSANHILVRSAAASSSSLVCLPVGQAKADDADAWRGRFGKRPPTIRSTLACPLADFDVDPTVRSYEGGGGGGGGGVGRVVLAGADGTLVVHTLPPFRNDDDDDDDGDDGLGGHERRSFPPTLVGPSEPVSARLETKDDDAAGGGRGGGIDFVRYHPFASSLLLSSTTSGAVKLWDLDSAKVGLELDADRKQAWNLAWSWDGGTVAATGRDGKMRLWDPRRGKGAVLTLTCHDAKARPSMLSFVAPSSPALVTTGFGAVREREWAIWDLRTTTSSGTATAAASPVKRAKLEPAPGVLEPLADADRGLVYLCARGESKMLWLDVGGAEATTAPAPALHADGQFALPFVGAACAMAPASACDVMGGEVGRLYFLTPPTSSGLGGAAASSADSVAPASVVIPRRQYIDFHADLYPETWDLDVGKVPTAKAWLEGEEAMPARVSQDPAKRSVGPAPALVVSGGKDAHPSPTIGKSANGAAGAVAGAGEQEQGGRSVPSGGAKGTSSDLQGAQKGTPVTLGGTAKSAAEGARQTSSENAAASVDSPASQQRTTPIAPATKSSAHHGESTKATTPTTHWSRRFLTGVTSLVPAYQNLSQLDTSRSADARMLVANATLLVWPLAGAGGRLGVHRVDRRGRLPSATPYLATRHGSRVGDFALHPSREESVVGVAEDGVLYAWDVDLEELRQLEERDADASARAKTTGGNLATPATAVALGEARRSAWRLTDGRGSSGRACELAWHPSAEDLLAVAPAGGEGKLHLVDVSSGVTQDGGGKVETDASGEAVEQRPDRSLDLRTSRGEPTSGCFSLSWSPDGRLLALCGRDKRLRVVDPRGGEEEEEAKLVAEAEAHGSLRSFRAVWLDNRHVLTAGHGAGSMRELLLFRLHEAAADGGEGRGELERVSSQSLDVSPAVPFVHWDADTAVLWVWSKGERSVHTFEVHPPPASAAAPPSSQALPTWTRLPTFQHAEPQLGLSWLHKTHVDVRDVEVARSVRLSASEMQVVSWRVTRARPEFFQDDVFPPTRPRRGATTAREWLKATRGGGVEVGGATTKEQLVDLRPEGMVRLSEAPPSTGQKAAATAAAKAASRFGKREETTEERNERLLDDAFAKAKKAGGATVDGGRGRGDDGGEEEERPVGAAAKRAPDNDDWDSD